MNFTLTAGAAQANRDYAMLGSVTGTTPGFPLPGGMVVMPLNFDLFTQVMIPLLNSAMFPGFMGTTDGTGVATAQLVAPPSPAAVGLTLDFAYMLYYPFDFVSNPVSVQVLP